MAAVTETSNYLIKFNAQMGLNQFNDPVEVVQESVQEVNLAQYQRFQAKEESLKAARGQAYKPKMVFLGKAFEYTDEKDVRHVCTAEEAKAIAKKSKAKAADTQVEEVQA